MSTRWYPIYQRGNPQLRVFLPNFWMKLVKLDKISTPSNKVNFIVSPQMNREDIKNYLEKIYKVPVDNVKTRNMMGEVYRNRFIQGELVKKDDYKIAFVTLPPGTQFQFPDLKMDTADTDYDKSKEEVSKAEAMYKKSVHTDDQKYRPGVPTFFGL